MNESIKTQYNTCKKWQVFGFCTYDLVTNAFLLLMNFVSYLAVGQYGILVGVASVIITGSRIFDGITDPIIAFFVEKTDGKFGRYRPMMLLGYIILTASVLLMYFFCVGGNIILFIALYMLYILGYTIYGTAAGGARSILTNDPMQRGAVGRWRGILIQLIAVLFSFYFSNYLARKHGGINLGALQELSITAIIVAGISLIFSIASIWDKDKPEYYGNISADTVKFSDIWKTLKGNRNLQMMILAASSDKLAQQTAGNSAISMMIWGIVAGNYAFSGKLNMITLLPMIFIMLYGTRAAMRKGSKHATILYSIANIISSSAIILLFLLGDPTKIGKEIGMTGLFLVIYCIYQGGKGVTNAVSHPMISDIADYELYRSGKFIPGIVNAVYGFVDKMVSSLAASIVGFVLACIGYVSTMPQQGDPFSSKILYAGLFVWMGLPILGWICSLIAMRYYTLDAKTMEEIQKANIEKKEVLKAASNGN